MKSSTQKYYLVSDLHMGGDGALQHCDYTTEFIEFLKGLERESPDTKLLIMPQFALPQVPRNEKSKSRQGSRYFLPSES